MACHNLPGQTPLVRRGASNDDQMTGTPMRRDAVATRLHGTGHFRSARVLPECATFLHTTAFRLERLGGLG